jgi:methylated-DNA-protein-cysteine methyltransferase-like protein
MAAFESNMTSALPEQISSVDAILITLASIPSGKVTTYGDVAKRSGFPGLARYVAKILKNLPEDTQIPWHRVINSQRKSSFPEHSSMHILQISRLQKEGVILSKSHTISKCCIW